VRLLPYLGLLPCRSGSAASPAIQNYIKQEADIQGKSNFFKKIVQFVISACILASYHEVYPP